MITVTLGVKDTHQTQTDHLAKHQIKDIRSHFVYEMAMAMAIAIAQVE